MIEFNAILYVGILIFYLLKKRYFNLGALLLTIYALSSVLSVSFYNHPFIRFTLHYNKLSMEGFIYLFTVLMIFFYPLLQFDETKIDKFIQPPIFKFRLLSLIAILPSIVSIIILVPFALKGMSGDISQNRDDIMTEGLILTNDSILKSIISLSHSLQKIALLLLFYGIVFFNKERLINWLLILPAIAYPILQSLSTVARGPLLFLVFSIFALFLLFKRSMTVKLRKIFNISFLIGGISLIIFFFIITFARFGSRDDNFDVSFFMYKYAGENFVNFSGIMYEHLRDTMDGDNCFPYFRKLLGLDFRTSLNTHRIVGARVTGIPIYFFYTFVGDLCIDFGFLSVFIIAVGFSIIFTKVLANNPFPKIYNILLYFIILTTFLEGLFIFNLQGNNQSIIVIAIVYFYLKYNFSSNFSSSKLIKNNL